MWSTREAIEIFHLSFLRTLASRIDTSLCVLKGGCNLRFYFRSIRHSEDLDLDVRTIAVPTLRNNVQRLLVAPAFVRSLQAQQIELAGSSAPKQSETTQRWKVQLLIGPERLQVPTKIEFSRRTIDDEHCYEPANAEIVSRYRLFPVLTHHYTAEAAFRQKLGALAQRATTQARDVFDLSLLLDAGAGKAPLPPVAREQLSEAIARALAIDYDEFSGQVIAYLEPQYQSGFRDPAQWERMQSRVVRALEMLAL